MDANSLPRPPSLRERLRVLLVPTDYSPPAFDALRHAEQLAQHLRAKIVLLHVFDESDYVIGTALGLGGEYGPVKENRARAHAMAEDKLQRLAEQARAAGCEVEAVLRDGPAVECIVREIASSGADLIVMSTHGRTGWRRFVMGSVAERVIRHAACPVLVTHARPNDVPAASATATGLAAAPLQLRQILVPTDFSAPAETALPWAEACAAEAQAALTLLHVMPPAELAAAPFDNAFALASTSLEEVYEAAIEARNGQLQAASRAVAERGNKVGVMLAHGQAAEKIVDVAHLGRCDLVVMAAHGSTHWAQALLGRTTEKVLRSAACPVLVVRDPVAAR